jgi:hypothetical protein
MRASVSIRGAEENGNEGPESHGLASGMDVLFAAYHTVHSFKGGVPALAMLMGMSPNVLASKLNVNSDTHHLSLKQAEAMMDIADNDAILFSLASHRGYDLVRTIPANTEDVSSLYWQVGAAFAEYLEAASDAMQHGVTNNSVRAASNRAADTMAHMFNLVSALRDRIPAPPTQKASPSPRMGSDARCAKRSTDTKAGRTPGIGSFPDERREGNSNPSRRVGSGSGSY